MIYNILRYYDKKRLETNIYKYIKKTPISKATYLSKFTNNNVSYKREDLQYSSMFNVRSACVQLLNLSNFDKKKGVAVYGYNNYTKGIMYMSNKLKIKSTIMLPHNTPRNIIHEINKYKYSLNKHNLNFDLIKNNSIDYNNIYVYKNINEGLEKKTVLDLLQDENIIVGNSSIAYEILHDYKKIDKIFVPMLNGNLMAGILVGIKNFSPKTKVIGVLYDDITIHDDEDDEERRPGILSSSNNVISNNAFDLCNVYLDDIIKVDIHDIDNAIDIIYNDTNVVVKPNGALSAAGIYKYTKMNNIQNENIIGFTNNTNYICF